MQEIESALAELNARKAALDAEAAELRISVIGRLTAIVDELGIKQEDLFGRKSAKRSAASAAPAKYRDPETGKTWTVSASAAPAKYRDPETGKTWTGRGKPPSWIKDLDPEARDALLI